MKQRHLARAIPVPLIVLALSLVNATEPAAPADAGSRPPGARTFKQELFPITGRDPERTVSLGEARAQNPGLIQLQAVTFDPIVDGEPPLADVLPEGPSLRDEAFASRSRHIVQFDGLVTRSTYRQLEGLHVSVLGYVPNNALLVELPPSLSPDALGSMAGVRYVGRFQAGYNLSPALFRRASAERVDSGAFPGPAHLIVSLFQGESSSDLGKALTARFPGIELKTMDNQAPALAIAAPESDLRGLVGALVRDPAVLFVKEFKPAQALNDNAVWIGQSYDRTNGPIEALQPDPKAYAASAPIWNHGITGRGQIVAVADTELEVDTCFFADPVLDIVRQHVDPPGPLVIDDQHRKVVAYNNVVPSSDLADIFRHGTHTSGIVAGDNLAHLADTHTAGHDSGDGMAPGAKILFEDLGGGDRPWQQCEGDFGAFNEFDLHEQEYQGGARIASNSWTQYSYSDYINAISYDHEDFLIVFAAGNFGDSYMSDEATAKNALAVGMAENWSTTPIVLDPENMAGGSSVGPTDDGRLKPDVVTPGVRVFSARFPVSIYDHAPYPPECSTSDPGHVCSFHFGNTDFCYIVNTKETCQAIPLTGTSMAAPGAAGLAALVRQYFVDGFYPTGSAKSADSLNPSAALVKSVLINSARNMVGVRKPSPGRPNSTELADAPSNEQGWGRVALDDALFFPKDKSHLLVYDVSNQDTDFRPTDAPATGETVTRQFTVASDEDSLKATLAWTDPGELQINQQRIVNDLDLEIEMPDGTILRGNQWQDDPGVHGDKQSLPSPSLRDAVNNVEGIVVHRPMAGVYTLRIRAANVPSSRGIQGYAVTVTGRVSGGCTDAASPADLRVSQLPAAHVALSWDPVPEAIGYRLYRNDRICTSPMAADTIFVLPAEPTSYVDTTTVGGTTYNYTVRAIMPVHGCETCQACETGDSSCSTLRTPDPPTITSVTPNVGRNNDPTAITIHGGGFVSPPQVFLGTNADPYKYPLGGVTLVGASEIHALVPVGLQSAAYDVRVVNPDLQEGVLGGGFRIIAPLQNTLVYTANWDTPGLQDDALSVFDLDHNLVLPPVRVGPVPRTPVDVAVTPDGSKAVVAEWAPYFDGAGGWFGRVGVVDLRTQAIAEVLLPRFYRTVAVDIHPSGNPAYVLAYDGAASPPRNAVLVLDLESSQLGGTIVPLGDTFTYAPLDDIEVSPDGNLVWATNHYEDTVSAVDTEWLTEVARIPVGQFPLGVTVSPDSGRAYVASYESDTVSVIDAHTLRVIDTWDVHRPGCAPGSCLTNPKHVAVSPDGGTAYVAAINGGSNHPSLFAFETASGKIAAESYGRAWVKMAYIPSLGELCGLDLSDNVIEIDPNSLSEGTVLRSGGELLKGMDFVEPVLTISSVAPALGCDLGGDSVTVSGAGFQGEIRDDAGAIVQEATGVFFNDVEATTTTLVDSHTLTVIVPPGQVGQVDVKVKNPNGHSATLSNGYRYLACAPACPNTNTCGCGHPVFDFDDERCAPGIDTGMTACDELNCQPGRTIHVRTCPCQGCGATWSTFYCY